MPTFRDMSASPQMYFRPSARMSPYLHVNRDPNRSMFICKSQSTPATLNTSSHSEQHLISALAACESAVRYGVQFGAADTLPSVLCCVVAEFLADSTTGELLSESSTGSSRPSLTPLPGTCCLEVKLSTIQNIPK